MIDATGDRSFYKHLDGWAHACTWIAMCSHCLDCMNSSVVLLIGLHKLVVEGKLAIVIHNPVTWFHRSWFSELLCDSLSCELTIGERVG